MSPHIAGLAIGEYVPPSSLTI